MSAPPALRHLVVVPAHNEAVNIERMLGSLLAQTEVPDRIVVVDDGSTDDTAERVQVIAAQANNVELVRRAVSGPRAVGSRVVEAFDAGYAGYRNKSVDYISKFDADLDFPADYCAELLGYLDLHPDIGVAGGALFDEVDGRAVKFRVPPGHVVGALKTIRGHVFREMGGFLKVSGWDVVDLVKIRMLGYGADRLEHLAVRHLRAHGAGDGRLTGKAHWGHAAYVIGSHPLFVIGRAIYRMLEPPYLIGGLALLYGYVRAMVRRTPRITDRELIKALRAEQVHRLRHSNRIPVRPGRDDPLRSSLI